jgi:Enoyl-CoA hydratase/isomerase
MTPSFEFMRLRTDARVAWIEFNRAPVNAFNRNMVEEVRAAIAAATTDPDVRVVALASAIDGYFSAGADLHVFEGMKGRDMRGWVSMCHEPTVAVFFQAFAGRHQRNCGRRRSRDGAALRPPLCRVQRETWSTGNTHCLHSAYRSGIRLQSREQVRRGHSRAESGEISKSARNSFRCGPED